VHKYILAWIMVVGCISAPLTLGADVAILPPGPPADSSACRGGTFADRCSVDLAPWEQGCSCSESCGFFGNCCGDIDTCDLHDPSSGRLVKDFGDGRQYFQSVLPKTAYGGSYQREETTYSFPTDRSAAWLSTVRFGDLDNTHEEMSVCRVDAAVPPSGTSALWYVHADKSVDWGNNDAKCGITGMTFPSTWSPPQLPQVSDVTRVETDGFSPGNSSRDLGVAVDSTGRLNSIVVLTSMESFEIDRGIVSCRAYMAPSDADNKLHWYVRAEYGRRPYDSVPAVACGFRKITFPDPAVVGIRSGDYQVSNYGGIHNSREQVLQKMTRDTTSACFFTEVTIGGTTEDELPGCEIKRAEPRISPPLYTDAWMLKAHAKEGKSNFATCSAMCVEFQDLPSERRPRTPTFAQHVEPLPDSEFLTLHQAGAYDRPILLVMGFNPQNTLGSTLIERQLAPLMNVLQSPGLEYDIWFYNVNGPKDIMAAARDVARAIGTVATFGSSFTGKVIVIGLSQGGLTSRIALTKWETGAYHESTGSEPVPGLTSNAPPVALLATIGAPHLGAAGPVSIVGAMTEIDRSLGLGDLSQSGIFGLINAVPSRQMLEKRLDCYQSWITQSCASGFASTFRNGRWERWGTTPGEDLGPSIQRCIEMGLCVGRDGCVYRTLPEFTDLFDIANTLGLRANGFPDMVPAIAIVNAGWAPQGCATLAPENQWCLNWEDSFSTNTTLAEVHFTDTGHSSLDHCDTISDIYLKMNAIDLRPGDLSDVQFVSLMSDAVNLPRQVTRLEIKQNSPFLRTHTESALYCPDAGSEPGCREQNRRERRFVDVLSRYGLDNRNGMHGSLHDEIVTKLLAYVYEYSLGNGDGRIDPGNPFGCRVAADGRTVCFCHGTREFNGNNFDDDCDGEVDEPSVTISGPEVITTKGTYTYTALPSEFQGSPTFRWSERFCEDAAGTSCTAAVTVTGLGETFRRTLGPDCTGTGGKTFWVRVEARDVYGRQAVAEMTTALCRQIRSLLP